MCDAVSGCGKFGQSGEVAEAVVRQSRESVAVETQLYQRLQSTDGAWNVHQSCIDDLQRSQTTVRQITGQQRVQLFCKFLTIDAWMSLTVHSKTSTRGISSRLTVVTCTVDRTVDCC